MTPSSSNSFVFDTTFGASRFTPTCSSDSLLNAMTPSQSKTSPCGSLCLKIDNSMKKDKINVSPILIQNSNQSIALKTPLIRHKPPDILKRQKKKKARKRISNLNKSNVYNKKRMGNNKSMMLNSSNDIDCNLVSTKKKCSNANSHQTQINSLHISSTDNIKQKSILKNITNDYFSKNTK